MTAPTAPPDLAQQLRDIDAELERADLSAIVRQALEEKRAAVAAEFEVAAGPAGDGAQPASGTVNVPGRAGVAVGVSTGTITYTGGGAATSRR